MMNNVSIVGIVGKLFYRETLNGGFVLNMSIVTNDYMGRTKGVVANWHQVVYFGDRAEELIEKFKLSTGDRVSIVGKIVYEAVNNNASSKGKIAKIYADKVTPIFCMRSRKEGMENKPPESYGDGGMDTVKRKLASPGDVFDRSFHQDTTFGDEDDGFGNV